jgi:PHD/YefM family antitoxin component YafN of YafNO toxin-antitoxin module
MKNLTLGEFTENLATVLSGVTRGGDMICVDAGKPSAFVIMDAAEYKILRDALAAMVTVAGSVEADGKTIDVAKLLEKLGG